MQFRERKRVIQVIRTTYDPELKRGRSKVVGKIDKAEPVVSDKLRRSCSEEELAEITVWLAQWGENLRSEAVRSGAATLAEQIRHATEFFRSQRSGEAAVWAAEIRAAWGPLEKALRKVDPAKPAKSKPPKAKAAARDVPEAIADETAIEAQIAPAATPAAASSAAETAGALAVIEVVAVAEGPEHGHGIQEQHAGAAPAVPAATEPDNLPPPVIVAPAASATTSPAP